MKNIWTPWRLEYVVNPERGKKTESGDCVFCFLAEAELNDESLVLYRDQDCYVVLNRFPYSNGHLMIIPTKHIALLKDLESEIVGKMFRWAQACTRVFEKVLSAQGFNIGMNLGSAAGAGIAPHLHLHVVPRWGGDTNFMPVIAEVKCIPEHLKSTFQRLKDPVAQEVGHCS